MMIKSASFYFSISLFFFSIVAIECTGQDVSQSTSQRNSRLVLLPSTFAQKANKIDSLISKYAEYSQFNGSILVSQNGQVIYKNGFGHANIEWDIENESDTKFRLASISKQFTALAIMQLAAEGQLDLKAYIADYLPNYPSDNAQKITVHQLLTHSSGIPNYTSFPGYRKMMAIPHAPDDIVQLFADSMLDFTPGQQFNYSNSGYVLLGMIIETLTGKSYEEVIHARILKPLKMNNSGYDSWSKVIPNRAAGYYNNGSNYINASYIDMSVAYSAGALYSTVEDLFLWDQALYTEILLPKEYLELIFQKHIPMGGEHYGYGWEIGEIPIGTSQLEAKTVSHSGGINGFSTLITRIPVDQSSIIILCNTSGAPMNHITWGIAGILNDQPFAEPKQAIAREISMLIKEKGLTIGLEFYQQVKDSSNYYLDEGEMNMAGYDFLNSNMTEEACAIFKLNVDAFPRSANVYDSYGEALLILGKREDAIANYKTSIVLNPKNENGIAVLKRLGID